MKENKGRPPGTFRTRIAIVVVLAAVFFAGYKFAPRDARDCPPSAVETASQSASLEATPAAGVEWQPSSEMQQDMIDFLRKIMEPVVTEQAWHYDFTEITKDTRTAVDFLTTKIPQEPKFSILEVGAGMSFVARTFANRTTACYSISVEEKECIRAHSYEIPHYKCIVHNKHHHIPNDFIPDESLDYVLDVNLASFSKIWQWNAWMLLRKIKPGGYLVTQQYGMDFTWHGMGSCQLTKVMLEAHQKYLGYTMEYYESHGVYMLKKNPK